jgi:hypothetical protein
MLEAEMIWSLEDHEKAIGGDSLESDDKRPLLSCLA